MTTLAQMGAMGHHGDGDDFATCTDVRHWAHVPSDAARAALIEDGVAVFDEPPDECACGHVGHMGRCPGTSSDLSPEDRGDLPLGRPCACEGTIWRLERDFPFYLEVAATSREQATDFAEDLWRVFQRSIERALDGELDPHESIGDALVDGDVVDEQRPYLEGVGGGAFYDDDLEVSVESRARSS